MNSTVEVFSVTDLDQIAIVKLTDAVTSMLTLEAHGIMAGLDNGELHLLSPFEDKVIISERHPFSEKICQIITTSRSAAGQCELAVVTAGQIYFTTIVLKSADGDEQGIEVPKTILFELDELYVEDGAQISRVEEYEPDKFIALTWWTNKMYLFKRNASFLVDQEINLKNTKAIPATFGLNFQCVGLFKIPGAKTLFLLKLKECLMLFDVES